MKGKRLTASAANAELPLVRVIVSDVADLTRRISDTERTCRAERQRPLPSQLVLNDGHRTLRSLESERAACADELGTLSVGVDDPAEGCVHFLGILDQRDVLFCWRLGEDRVDTWRDVDEPFHSRRPLPEPVLA